MHHRVLIHLMCVTLESDDQCWSKVLTLLQLTIEKQGLLFFNFVGSLYFIFRDHNSCCCAVKCLPTDGYSVVIFTFSRPLELLGSDIRKQNTAEASVFNILGELCQGGHPQAETKFPDLSLTFP